MKGWLITTKSLRGMLFGKGMKKILPGLQNFYTLGQWVEPGGGIRTGAMTARNVLQLIYHQEKRLFKTKCLESHK